MGHGLYTKTVTYFGFPAPAFMTCQLRRTGLFSVGAVSMACFDICTCCMRRLEARGRRCRRSVSRFGWRLRSSAALGSKPVMAVKVTQHPYPSQGYTIVIVAILMLAWIQYQDGLFYHTFICGTQIQMVLANIEDPLSPRSLHQAKRRDGCAPTPPKIVIGTPKYLK